MPSLPPLLAVVPYARHLRLLDRDHHGRDDRHAGQDVGAQFLVDVRAAAAAPAIWPIKLRRWVVDSEFTDVLLLFPDISNSAAETTPALEISQTAGETRHARRRREPETCRHGRHHKRHEKTGHRLPRRAGLVGGRPGRARRRWRLTRRRSVRRSARPCPPSAAPTSSARPGPWRRPLVRRERCSSSSARPIGDRTAKRNSWSRKAATLTLPGRGLD